MYTTRASLLDPRERAGQMLQLRPAHGARRVFLTEDQLVLYDPEVAGLFGKIKKAVKKVVKSKVFKYAAIGAAVYFTGGAVLKYAPQILAKLKEAKAAKAAAKTQEQAEKAAAEEAKLQAEYDAAVRAAASQAPAPAPAVVPYVPAEAVPAGGPVPPIQSGVVERVTVTAPYPESPAYQAAGFFSGDMGKMLPWLAVGGAVFLLAGRRNGGSGRRRRR